FVGAGALVTADGQSGVEVASGKFNVSYLPTNSGFGNLDPSTGHRPTPADINIGLPHIDPPNPRGDGTNFLTDPSFSGERTLALATDPGFHGLAITATNRDDLRTFTVGIAGGEVGVAVSAGIGDVTAQTRAYVGANAQINADTSGASAAQSVMVAAG